MPQLSRALHLVPPGTTVVVRLDGSFMDHAAYESLRDWQRTHTAQGGSVELSGCRHPESFTRTDVTETPQAGVPSLAVSDNQSALSKKGVQE